jgi:hypothetical protein
MLFYRFGVRGNICEPVDACLPLTRAVLTGDGAWAQCCSEFLAARTLSSPFYRDIAPTFLGWLAATGWGRDRWPFLLELVHFELVQELVEHLPDRLPPPGLRRLPAPELRLLPAPSTQTLSYGHALLEATLENPVPPARPCQLLANRGGDGFIQWRELSPATATLLVRAQSEAIGAAARALGLDDDPDLLEFLAELCDQGVLWGFQ